MKFGNDDKGIAQFTGRRVSQPDSHFFRAKTNACKCSKSSIGIIRIIIYKKKFVQHKTKK